MKLINEDNLNQLSGRLWMIKNFVKFHDSLLKQNGVR